LFNILRNRSWFVPPLISSILSSFLDTVIFFGIAFYGTDSSWIMLAIGDLTIKLIFAFIMLLPFKILIAKFN
jgi:uncharacterized PurR-regulated membrane protein YhhQ (DUF165 family)